MLTAITKWQHALTQHTDLDRLTVTQYIGDAQRFVTWFRTDERGESFADVTVQDAKDYRDASIAARRAPATVNRTLISLALLLDASGRGADNPFRKIARVSTVEHPPQALTRVEWHAVRRVAERLTTKDHGLALALTCLIRYAGPCAGEVSALQLPDVQLSPRRGLLIIRRGKGLKHREVPLVLEAREPLETCLEYRRQLAARWVLCPLPMMSTSQPLLVLRIIPTVSPPPQSNIGSSTSVPTKDELSGVRSVSLKETLSSPGIRSRKVGQSHRSKFAISLPRGQ